MLTGHSRLDSGIEGKEVGLIGNVFDDADDFADFVGTFTQALDLLSGFLHILADEQHTFNCLAYSLLATTGVVQGILRSFGTELGITSNVLNKDSQGFHGLGGMRNLGHLSFGCLGEFSGVIQDTTSSIGDLDSGGLHPADNLGKLLNHVVEGVSQDTQGVWCNLGLDPKVTITDGTHLLEEFFNLCL